MWVLQNNIYTEDFNEIVKTLTELGLPYTPVKVIPFSTKLNISISENENPIIAYGSTTLIKLCPSDWVWYNEDTFKPSVWGEKIGDRYLNSDAEIYPLNSVLKNWHGSRNFIRPDSDLKLFSGDVFMKGDFLDWYIRIEELINTGTYVNLKLDTLVSISPYQKIIKEWRFFIVDREIVGSSQYKDCGRLSKSKNVDIGALVLAKNIAKLDWQLAIGYVLDIALIDSGEYKVIEFNNFNSSGFYECDIKNILSKASKFLCM